MPALAPASPHHRRLLIAEVALAVGLAVVSGALFGAFIGLASSLAALLRKSWSLASSAATSM